jgi:hypothetical protein
MVWAMIGMIGFGASERIGAADQRAALSKAHLDAKAHQKQLIEKQLSWNQQTFTKQMGNRQATKELRNDAVASTERLIFAAGHFKAGEVYSAKPDAQVNALSKLTTLSEEWVAVGLVVGLSILALLCKPLFLGLATFEWHQRMAEIARRREEARGEAAKPLTAEATAPVATTATVQEPATAPAPANDVEPITAEEVKDTPVPAPAAKIEEVVDLATERERRAADELATVRRFIREMTVSDPTGRHNATHVFDVFRQWHEGRGMGLAPITQTMFGRYCGELGVKKEPHHGYINYTGIALKGVAHAVAA